MALKLGEVRAPTDEICDEALKLFKDNTDWETKYNKKNIYVGVKITTYSDFKIVKTTSKFDVSAETLYDTLHDEEYRKYWDKNMFEGYQIAKVSDCSDITYYAFKSPFVFKNRDFVTHRSWRVKGDEFFIFNHSVFHKNFPPKKDFVRGLSYVTGYLIKKVSDSSAEFTYLTQSDPRGYIPAWAINKGAEIVIPKTTKRLAQAAIEYPEWKKSHNPDFKPWLHPEQSKLPKYNQADILDRPDFDIADRIDERNNEQTHNYP